MKKILITLTDHDYESVEQKADALSLATGTWARMAILAQLGQLTMPEATEVSDG